MYEVSEDHLKITGFATLAEWWAYDLGKQHEETLFMKFIKEWDGEINSSAGQLLYDKVQEQFVKSATYQEFLKLRK